MRLRAHTRRDSPHAPVSGPGPEVPVMEFRGVGLTYPGPPPSPRCVRAT